MVVALMGLELVATMIVYMIRLYSISLYFACTSEPYGQKGVNFDLESEESALVVTDLKLCWLCIMDYGFWALRGFSL